MTQMHEWINVVFHVSSESCQYLENMECNINVALNCKNEIFNCKDELLNRRNEIKIKYDNFSIFGEKLIWVYNSNRSNILNINTPTQIFQVWPQHF